MSEIQMIPLDRLDLSPMNVRKTRSKEHIAQMAASIEAQGVLQNLIVHDMDGGKFGVVIGGTRHAALSFLAKQKKIAVDYPVPCEVRLANDPTLTEVSLAENVVREAMHPADEFDAFKKLAEGGQRDETIAARFGVTASVVKQRLKLAVVSPKLISLYRKDEMTLDQLMAFTISDSHKQQEKVWRELEDWQRSRGDGDAIRGALTEQHAAADSKLAKFVGLEVYEKAGGGVLRDLFDEQGRGWLTDLVLLNRIVTEQMEAVAGPIRAEGWKFVEIVPTQTWDDTKDNARIYPRYADPTSEQRKQIDALQAEADSIMEEHGEEPQDEKTYDRLSELQQHIDGLGEGEEVWTDAQKAISGVTLTINRDGEIVVQRGVVKPEDKAALRKLEKADGEGGDEPEAPAKKKGGLPAALIAELTSHKTVAAQLVMATNTKIALMAVTHVLALKQLYPQSFGEHSVLQISAHAPTFPMAIRDAVEKSPAGKKLAAVVKSWRTRLPKKPEQLWSWMEKQTPATIQSLLAVCAATIVDIVQSNGADAKPAALDLAKAIKLDMADHWAATAENYFTRVPKKHLLEQLAEDLKPNVRQQIVGMKRDAAAKTIVNELKGKRWIPSVMRNG